MIKDKVSLIDIESHLSHFVSNGEFDIEELVSCEKLLLIEPAIRNFCGGAITPIKEKLRGDVGFGEIKLVLAWQEYQNSLQQNT
jgi:ATP-dependent DNA helicase RecQ